MKKYLSILAISCLLNLCQLNAQQLDSAKLNVFFDAIEINDEGSGSVCVMLDGKPIYKRAYGSKDYENDIAPDEQTQYRIGSITKTFTASLIMMAVEEQKLTLDTRLSDFYPQFDKSDSITISHLLRHRSGLYNFTNSPGYALYMAQKKTKAEMLEIMEAGENQFSPGTAHEYSNTGYVLLSFILEDIYDKSYKDLLYTRIFNPLGLRRTVFENQINADENEAFSYYKTTEWSKAPIANMSIPMGAGGISSTAAETSQFFHALFSEELVSANSLEKMTSMVDNYGFGIFEIPFYDKTLLGHTGGIDAFQAVSVYDMKEKLSVTVLCNAVSYARNDILIALLSAYYGRAYEIPDFKAVLVLTKDQMRPYEGTYKSDTFPLAIDVKLNNEVLEAQATGQSAFPLTAIDETTFEFKPAGIKMIFNKEVKTLTLNQAGREFVLLKE